MNRIMEQCKRQVYDQVHQKYKVMRIRSKISYEALLKRMTILELFLSTILKCRQQFIESGAIAKQSTNELNKQTELM